MINIAISYNKRKDYMLFMDKLRQAEDICRNGRSDCH